uniref:Uncharacterized protein n=1 Tax=Arundo donax TaxID=35708 RepID=A0A0A9B4S4_ARUDO
MSSHSLDLHRRLRIGCLRYVQRGHLVSFPSGRTRDTSSL